MKKIIYTLPDGGVAVVHPVINTFGEAEGFTEENAIHRALAKLPEGAIDPAVVDESEIPKDRSFRGAWVRSHSGIAHDMDMARAIHLDRLRKSRKPKLEALDVESLRAIEAGDFLASSDVMAQKQALRDITKDPRIAEAQTPDELKLVIPEALL